MDTALGGIPTSVPRTDNQPLSLCCTTETMSTLWSDMIITLHYIQF